MRTNFLETLREFDTEWIVLGTMFVVSGYLFWVARQYSPSSAEFPRMTSGIVLVFGTVVVASKVIGFQLPGDESTRLGSTDELDGLDDVESDEIQQQIGDDDVERPQTLEEYVDDLQNLTILSVLILLYLAAILTVGLIFSSFLFVFLYAAVWKRMKWYEIIILLGATAAILWMFQTQLNIELNRTYFDTGWRELVDLLMRNLPVLLSETFDDPVRKAQIVIEEVIN